MKKLDQPPQLAMSIKVPVTQCCSEEPWLALELWWVCPPKKLSIGPLYSVITIAPDTVIAVPITFARLCIFLRFTFSNLFDN